jgi:hypothetical protein
MEIQMVEQASLPVHETGRDAFSTTHSMTSSSKVYCFNLVRVTLTLRLPYANVALSKQFAKGKNTKKILRMTR